LAQHAKIPAAREYPVDKSTYSRYQSFPEGELSFLAGQFVHVTEPAAPDSLYARIDLTPSGFCPFLATDNLCKIQSAFGADYLSATCSTYPRVLNSVDDGLEASLHLSCPEAARQVLLNPCSIDRPVQEPSAAREPSAAKAPSRSFLKLPRLRILRATSPARTFMKSAPCLSP
jgi:lysine-N-methylase